MRYSFISAAVLAFSSSAFAQTPGFDAMNVSPAANAGYPAGGQLDIKWEVGSYTTNKSTIELLHGGSAGTLFPASNLTTLDNSEGHYLWNIPTDLEAYETYGIRIWYDVGTDDPTKQIFQYSYPFHITGLKGESSASASGSVTASATTTILVGTGTAYSASSTSSANSTMSRNATTTTSSSNFTITASPTASTTLPTTAAQTTPEPAATSSSAAIANFVSGGLAAAGGLVLAFAL